LPVIEHVGVWVSKILAPSILIVDFYPRPLYPCREIPNYPLNRRRWVGVITGLDASEKREKSLASAEERTAILLLSTL
jgi:hypothetical protein